MHLGFALRRHSRHRGCDPTCRSQLVKQSKVKLLHLSLCLVPGWSTSSYLLPEGKHGYSPSVGALSMDIPIHSCDPPARWSCLCLGDILQSSNLVSSTQICCQEEPHQPSASDHMKSPWILCLRILLRTFKMGLASGQEV